MVETRVQKTTEIAGVVRNGYLYVDKDKIVKNLPKKMIEQMPKTGEIWNRLPLM